MKLKKNSTQKDLVEWAITEFAARGSSKPLTEQIEAIWADALVQMGYGKCLECGADLSMKTSFGYCGSRCADIAIERDHKQNLY